MDIPRLIKKQLTEDLKPMHVTGLFGARRTGKTFLMNQIINEIGKDKILLVQGDDLDAADILSSQRSSLLSNFSKGYNFLLYFATPKNITVSI